MIKVILFDVGGVIFKSEGGTYEGREKLAKILQIDKNLLHKIWFEKKKGLLTGKISEQEYIDEIVSKSNTSVSSEEIKEKIRSLSQIDEDMLHLVDKLKSRYKLAALTNEVGEWNEFRCKKFNLENHFSILISSSDVGMIKPDKEIYLLTIKKLNVKPEEILFIDDREENLVIPKELGLKTIHFKGIENLKIQLKNLGIL